MSVLAFLLFLVAAAFSLARWVGLGYCWACGRPCVPWNDRCWQHNHHP